MQAELRFQPLLLLLCYGDRRRRMELLQTFSSPSPALLQTFSRPLPGLVAPDRDLSGWVMVRGHRMLNQEQHQLFWSHLRCVSLAQAASAALPLEGMGETWNFEPFGVTWALLTDFFSL